MHRISGQWESSPAIPSSCCGCSPITSRMQAPGRRPFALPSWAERNASVSLPVGRAFVPMRLRSRACRYVHTIMPRCRFSAETWQTARPSSPCIPTSRTSTAFPGQAKAGEERLPGRRWSRSSCRESSSRSSPSPLARVCTRCCDRITRPAYTRDTDENRMFWLAYDGFVIWFTVCERCLRVVDAMKASPQDVAYMRETGNVPDDWARA